MPTNAEIHAAIDLLIRQPHSHILTNEIADMLDDIVDNIGAGPGGTLTLDEVLAAGATLSVDRTIDLNGKKINIKEGDDDLLLIDPTPDSEISKLQAYNETGDDNTAYFVAQANNSGSQFSLNSDFNGGIKFANIVGQADASESNLAFIAQKYRFQNVQEFANNAAAITGGLSAGMLYIRTGHGLDIVT